MRSISESKYISERNLRRFYTAQIAVAMMPDDILGHQNRCHELARAIAPVVDGEVRDGKFGSVDHSWIHLEYQHGAPLILDVYAVAKLPQVQLLNLSWHVRGLQNCYVEDDVPRDDIREDVLGVMREMLSGLLFVGRIDLLNKLYGEQLRSQVSFILNVINQEQRRVPENA